MIRWYKGIDPVKPDGNKQILFYAGGSSFPYIGWYHKHNNTFNGDWKADDVQKWQYVEYILELADRASDVKIF